MRHDVGIGGPDGVVGRASTVAGLAGGDSPSRAGTMGARWMFPVLVQLRKEPVAAAVDAGGVPTTGSVAAQAEALMALLPARGQLFRGS